MPFTRGFATPKKLQQHFQAHGAEFNAKNASEYEALADTFLGGPLGVNTREHIRVFDGALVRFDLDTEEFGILRADNYIQTYFIPDPRWHRFFSNYKYFEYECTRKK